MNTHRPDAPELLRWWHQHQAQKLNQVSDHIRNGLMQELFAIRRQLEVSCETEDNAAAFGCDLHLANLERIYHQLEHLSHDLTSPFTDSLPLALQHAVQPWQQQISLTTELPSTWSSEPVEHIQLFITFIDSLFSQLATNPPQHCSLELTQQATAKKLICCATGEHLSPRVTESLLPLLETFRLLTQGEYNQTLQPQLIRWELRWPSALTLSSIAPEYSHDHNLRPH